MGTVLDAIDRGDWDVVCEALVRNGSPALKAVPFLALLSRSPPSLLLWRTMCAATAMDPFVDGLATPFGTVCAADAFLAAAHGPGAATPAARELLSYLAGGGGQAGTATPAATPGGTRRRVMRPEEGLACGIVAESASVVFCTSCGARRNVVYE